MLMPSPVRRRGSAPRRVVIWASVLRDVEQVRGLIVDTTVELDVDDRTMGVRDKIVPGMRAHNGTAWGLIEEEHRFTVRLWK